VPPSAALCQRKLTALILDGSIPPTFADRDARHWQPGRVKFDVDAHSGQRLSVACLDHPDRQSHEIARWPALAAPWLSAAQRRAQQLPALATDCPPDRLDNPGVLHIEGLSDRTTLIRPPGSRHPPRLQLRALGSSARIDWLLNGRQIAHTKGSHTFTHEFAQTGEHTLTALAADGAWASVRFRVEGF